MKLNDKNNLNKLVLAGLIAALTLLLTMVAFPLPTLAGAYVNLGDIGVYLAAYALGGGLGALSAGIGSMLADILLGSALYALPTFFIKGTMALAAALLLRRTGERRFVSLALAGLVMPLGYFLFESFLYGTHTAFVGMLPNLGQYAAGVSLALPVLRIAEQILHRRAK